MDTTPTTQSRSKSNGCAASVTGECIAKNNRLIAAAPTTYQQLDDLIRAAQAMLDCTDDSERGYLSEETAKARALLTKIGAP